MSVGTAKRLERRNGTTCARALVWAWACVKNLRWDNPLLRLVGNSRSKVVDGETFAEEETRTTPLRS